MNIKNIFKNQNKYSLLFLIFFVMFFLNFSYAFAKSENVIIERIKNNKVLKCSVSADFPPFEFIVGQDVVGIDVEIAKEIAKFLGVEIKINNVSFDTLVLELLAEKCDVLISAMCPTEEKRKVVDFSKPYFESKHSILVKNDSEISSVRDLNNKRIGVILGSTTQSYCEEKYKNNLIVYNSLHEAVLGLISDQIDALASDYYPASMFLKKHINKIRMLDEELFKESYCISLPKNEPELMSIVNRVIENLQKDGKIDGYLNFYIADEVFNFETSSKNNFFENIYNNLVKENRYKFILKGLLITFEITFFAALIGLILGSLSAICIVVNKNKIYNQDIKSKFTKTIFKIFGSIFDLYVSIVRGTPIICQLFILYYVVLNPLGFDKIFSAIFAFGFNSGAYVSEIVRNSILSVERGQIEASKALGLSSKLTFIHVVAPQALKYSLALFCNEIVQLIKETSVSGLIGIVDLSRAAEIIRSQTLQPFVPLITVATIYFLVIYVINYLVRLLEKKLRKDDGYLA